MVLTPLAWLANERFVLPRVGTKPVEEQEPDVIEEENPVIIAGFGKFGQIVGRLLTANGVGTTVLDIDSDRVDLLRKLGIKVYYGDASRYDMLATAGAGSAKILVLALDSPEKTLELVHTVRKHFPHLQILARAEDRYDAYELHDAEVQHIYRETLDTSLRMGIDVLRLLGFRSYQAHRAARTFFRHDEDAVQELATMRDDHATYINVARQRISDLEQMLLADLEKGSDHGRERDAAWDVTTLREDIRQQAMEKEKEDEPAH
jgi:voltage-gated potassium channel Kch